MPLIGHPPEMKKCRDKCLKTSLKVLNVYDWFMHCFVLAYSRGILMFRGTYSHYRFRRPVEFFSLG